MFALVNTVNCPLDVIRNSIVPQWFLLANLSILSYGRFWNVRLLAMKKMRNFVYPEEEVDTTLTEYGSICRRPNARSTDHD